MSGDEWESYKRERFIIAYHSGREAAFGKRQSLARAKEALARIELEGPRLGPITWHGSGVEPCSRCNYIAEALCDYPMGDGKTCDAPLCREHRRRMSEEDDVDFCSAHAIIAEKTDRTLHQ